MTLRLFALTAAALATLAMPARAEVNPQEPLPRFEDRLCPGIIGLERGFAEQMVARIRANAQSAGVRLADEATCDANVIIAFVDDGQAYLADLVDRRSYLFSDMDRPDLDAMLAQQGPVTVWHQVTARTRDGIRVGGRDNLMDLPEAGMWQAHSRIYRPVRHDITYSLVLFDRAAVAGLSLRQLADHASLRALATAFPDETGVTEASILTLFDGSETQPDALTAFDTAWLNRLYSGIPNVPASTRLRGVQVSSAE